MTTFARIAKILKGLVEPRNWVEEAFAEGGGGGVLIIHANENGVLDKTWKEIADAIPNGAVIVVNLNGGVSIAAVYASAIGMLAPRYQISAYDYANGISQIFTAATENDYPELEQQ